MAVDWARPAALPPASSTIGLVSTRRAPRFWCRRSGDVTAACGLPMSPVKNSPMF
jgi:hypothetical protein